MATLSIEEFADRINEILPVVASDVIAQRTLVFWMRDIKPHMRIISNEGIFCWVRFHNENNGVVPKSIGRNRIAKNVLNFFTVAQLSEMAAPCCCRVIVVLRDGTVLLKTFKPHTIE